MRGIVTNPPLLPANLSIHAFRFAASDPTQTRRPALFEPGENLFLLFEVDGYKFDGARVWLEEDMSVRYPDGSMALKLENISTLNRELTQTGPVRFENNIALPPNAQPGRYTVTITIRDKLAKQELKEQRFFYISSPGSRGSIEPNFSDSLPEKGAENEGGNSSMGRPSQPQPTSPPSVEDEEEEEE